MTTISSPVVVPAALADIAARVNVGITATLDTDAARWGAVDPELCAPLAALRAMVLSGGKRLRPAFCYWAFVGLGGDPTDPRVIDAGAALELLHSFALIHDDVMDGSGRRHGIDTVHEDFTRRHRSAGWRGDSERFGAGVAILVGDLAFVYADLLITEAPLAALQVWNELRVEVNVGQYLDLIGSATGTADLGAARRIRQYKSGKYTVERPLHLGAALADPCGLAELVGPLSDYGMPLGEAFQLRDDLLGVWGDPSVTGKPVGEDLRDGKPTMLAALARQHARGADAALLEARFGAPDLTGAEVTALQEIFETTGARERVSAAVDSLAEQALAALDRLPVTTEATVALGELARFVAGRNH
jgi:geranylgeranyl diphosphate synthase type I